MDLSAKMLQWLTQQGFHAVRAGNTALFPRLKSYLVAVKFCRSNREMPSFRPGRMG